jgi:hypothetical protein
MLYVARFLDHSLLNDNYFVSIYESEIEFYLIV